MSASITAFECYQLFHALKAHFWIESCDYFGQGIPGISPRVFASKPSDYQYRFERLAKKFRTREELENFIVANLIDSGKGLWAGDLAKGQANEKYRLFQYGGTIEYRLISELRGLIYRNRSGPGSTASGLDNLIDSDVGQHPEILKARMRWTHLPNTGDVIGPENFVLLNMCLDFFPRIDKNLPDDRPWIRIRSLSNKYRPFIERQKIDVEQLRQAVLGAIS